jgi:hypothetical protein
MNRGPSACPPLCRVKLVAQASVWVHNMGIHSPLVHIMFEHRSKPVLPRPKYYRRLAKSVLAGAGLVAVSLAVGMVGYHFFENLSWIDAFANASMILSGMGPLGNLQTAGGKLFAGCYALYSGLVLILVAGVVFAPVVHRFLHKFHVEESKAKRSDG